MREKVNVHEAKTRLSQLLEGVEGGREFVIARAGKPVALLIPVPPAMVERRPGAWRGRVSISKDFDELPEEIQSAFSGEQA